MLMPSVGVESSRRWLIVVAWMEDKVMRHHQRQRSTLAHNVDIFWDKSVWGHCLRERVRERESQRLVEKYSVNVLDLAEGHWSLEVRGFFTSTYPDVNTTTISKPMFINNTMKSQFKKTLLMGLGQY